VIAAGALVVAYLVIYVGKVLGGGWTLTVIVAVALFLIGVGAPRPESSKDQEQPENRVMGTLIYVRLHPLPRSRCTLLIKTADRQRVTPDWTRRSSTHSMRNTSTAFDAGGGAYHAIIGTIEAGRDRRPDLGAARHPSARFTSSNTAGAGSPNAVALLSSMS